MNCFNGSTPNYLIHEIKALSRLQNDITCVTQDTLAITTTAQKAQIVQFGYYKMGTLNLDGVRDFEIKRDTATPSLEFIMLDRVKTTVVG